MTSQRKVNVNEIFVSINGEVTGHVQGSLTTFVRLQGCNLRCSYCDTPDAQSNIESAVFHVDDVVKTLEKIGCETITFTGGEPLLQHEALVEMMALLWHSETIYEPRITIETNGTWPGGMTPFQIESNLRNYLSEGAMRYFRSNNLSWVVDYKLHAQEMIVQRILTTHLTKHDWVKFVIDTPEDYESAKDVVRRLLWESVLTRPGIAFSTTTNHVSRKQLVDWAVRDKLWEHGVVINVQIHKIIEVK